MKIILLFIVLFAGVRSANAQTYFVFSEKMINANFSVFSPLADRAFPAMDEGILQIRTGVKLTRKKSTINANLSYLLSNDRNILGAKTARLYGYSLGIGAQYDWFKWQSFSILPSIELGVRKYNLIYTETVTTTDPASFRTRKKKYDVFSFSGIGMYGDIGLSMEKHYPMKRRTFGIGFGLGYRFDYGYWKINDPTSLAKSKANQNGIYIEVSMLIPFKRTKKDEID